MSIDIVAPKPIDLPNRIQVSIVPGAEHAVDVYLALPDPNFNSSAFSLVSHTEFN